jgi:hypothetical protein
MDVYRGGERRTIGQVLMAAIGYPEDDLQPNPARRVLEGIGVKLILTDAGNFLKVANQHVGLTRIFDGTRWAEGKWRDALHYLPGAIPGGREQFAGAQSRCTQLPEAYLPSKPVVETAAGDPRESLG